MIDDLLIRWVVTALFVLSGAEFAVGLVTNRRPWSSAVSDGLHLLMAIAMLAMAWPWGATLPTTGPAAFFVLAALWFMTMTVVSARTIVQRTVCGYHGLMMAAMAWMYAAMDGHLGSDGSMQGMDMTANGTPASGGPPQGWISAVDWFWFLGFAGAAIFWTYRSLIERLRGALPYWHSWAGGAAQALMAAGMAIMFGAKLFHI